MVVTGEGQLDVGAFDGKVVGGVAARAARRGVPVIAIVGAADSTDDPGIHVIACRSASVSRTRSRGPSTAFGRPPGSACQEWGIPPDGMPSPGGADARTLATLADGRLITGGQTRSPTAAHHPPSPVAPPAVRGAPAEHGQHPLPSHRPGRQYSDRSATGPARHDVGAHNSPLLPYHSVTWWLDGQRMAGT